MKEILSAFGFDEAACTVNAFGTGLINSTWLVQRQNGKYILQRINDKIFKRPEDIAFNIRLMAEYLKKNFPDYLFVAPCKTNAGSDIIKWGDGYYRIFPFISGSHTIPVAENPQQAYEAAKQFAKFSRLLSKMDASVLKITVPHFHDLSLRYQQFENALETGNAERIEQSKDLVNSILKNKNIVEEFEMGKPNFRTRCIHHDTKISNVLLDETDRGLCVIDLDTVMPGYFISDLGDMMRTYLCPVSEEEKDFSKICVRKEFYYAIADGYLSEMGAELTTFEKEHFHYAGEFMIYMQAIRFLTDHINNDVYYGAKYTGHNFVRAGNQITLLQRLQKFNPG